MSGFEAPDWVSIFTPDLSLLESFLRASVVYLSLIVLFRLILKRQTGSLGLPDVMLVVLVSECVAQGLTAKAYSVPNALAGVAALLLWDYALDRLAYRWPWLRRRLEPEPLVLVKDGKPLRENLAQEGVLEEELEAQLRLHGIDNLTKVKQATMESGGEVSVIPKEEPAAAPDPAVSTGQRDLDRITRQLLAAAAELQKAAERRAAKKSRSSKRRGKRRNSPPPNERKE